LFSLPALSRSKFVFIRHRDADRSAESRVDQWDLSELAGEAITTTERPDNVVARTLGRMAKSPLSGTARNAMKILSQSS
jgi:hypothetical protein